MEQQSSRGRPRSFDSLVALDKAMQVFWAEGYEGASMERLCRSMGMPRASLYEDYAGKEELFLAAVAHYAQTRLVPVIAALGPKGTLREDIRSFLGEALKLATSEPDHRGCLIACALSDSAGTHVRFRKELDRRFSFLEEKIADRLRSAGHNVGGNASPESMAIVVASITRGLMVRARAGTKHSVLRAAADAAVAALFQTQTS